MKSVRVLLISTYDLGRQPFGLASPAAWLRREGIDVDCIDTSRESLSDDTIRAAAIAAFYLPMHTATRLARPLIDRVRTLNRGARIVAYGLYAPLNAAWLRGCGVSDVLGPEAEEGLVALAKSQVPTAGSGLPKLRFIPPDRSALPPLSRYAALQMPDGSKRVVGATEATRGCKHLCRHCPIVPVYRGAFRAVPVDVVLADVAAQVASGAQHISFADPDFFNGPTHARRIVERMAADYPAVTYDVTIKIEHLLKHADMLPLLGATGCLFVTSAVESIDPIVLRHLRKGHTPEDFAQALALCREAGVRLSPTFVPFTPWTTVAGYVELLDQLTRLGLEDDVAPIQLAIRLLVTADSALLELEDIRNNVEPFDPASLTWPWRHRDPAVDRLQADVMRVVAALNGAPRRDVFDAIGALARGGTDGSIQAKSAAIRPKAHSPVPHLTEAWYCCAEPGPDITNYV
jgi:radical SAM superfamily enzyme YgiQ (UPF0313 family)